MSTHPRPSLLAATTLLAGALATSACGGVDERPPAATAESSPAPAEAAPEADPALGAEDRSLAADRAERLRNLRLQHPTAGLEVPPPSLRAGGTTTSSPQVDTLDDQKRSAAEPADRFARYVE